MARLGAWVQAGRPVAQIPVFATILFGQALAYRVHRVFHVEVLALSTLLGVCIGLVAIFANDAVDVAVDVANGAPNPFAGSSRVVPERKIAPFALVQASLVSLLAVGAISAFVALRAGRPWMLVLASMSAHLAWMYGFPPFRLSYRGYGEFLQGFGTALLVAIGYYAAAATVEGLRPSMLVAPFLLGHAANVTAGLSDTPADASVKKRTLSVRRGEPRARRTSLAFIVLAAFVAPFAAPGRGVPSFAVSFAIGAAVAVRGFSLLARADSSDPKECARFMMTSHAGIVALFVAWSLTAFAG